MEKKINKKIISVSDINGWLYCPRKIYLNKVCNLPVIQNRAMVIGKLKHNIIEIFSKQEESFISKIDKDYDKIDLAFMFEDFLNQIANNIFIANHASIEKFMIDPADILKKVHRDFSEDIRLRIQHIKEKTAQSIFGNDIWKSLETIYISEMKVESDIIGLRGRIDRVLFSRKDNSVIPFELKSREDNIFHSDEIQLTAYAMLLEEKYLQKISRGIIEVGNNKKEISISEENKKEVLQIADLIRNIETNPIPPILSNFNKCRYCDFQEECGKLK